MTTSCALFLLSGCTSAPKIDHEKLNKDIAGAKLKLSNHSANCSIFNIDVTKKMSNQMITKATEIKDDETGFKQYTIKNIMLNGNYGYITVYADQSRRINRVRLFQTSKNSTDAMQIKENMEKLLQSHFGFTSTSSSPKLLTRNEYADKFIVNPDLYDYKIYDHFTLKSFIKGYEDTGISDCFAKLDIHLDKISSHNIYVYSVDATTNDYKNDIENYKNKNLSKIKETYGM